MDVFSFACIAICVGAGASLLTKVIENDRETRIAKIEADLKRDLVDRLGDPKLVAQVLEAKLSGGATPGEESSKGRSDSSRSDVHAANSHVAAHSGGGDSGELLSKKDSQGLLLGGLITTLVGVAFCVLCGLEGDDYAVPAVLCTAVGLALLAFPAMKEELGKAATKKKIQSEA